MTDGERGLSPGAKRALRAACRRRRLALSLDDVAARSARIVERVLPLCQRRQRVALFSPMELRREVDLRMLDATLRASGVAVYYPWQKTTGDGVLDASEQQRASAQTMELLDETEPSTPRGQRPAKSALARPPAGGRSIQRPKVEGSPQGAQQPTLTPWGAAAEPSVETTFRCDGSMAVSATTRVGGELERAENL